MYTLSDILDQIQELMGQPQGSFYNMESRMRAIQATHDSLVRGTGALIKRGIAVVSAGQTLVGDFPPDFMAFAGSPIVFRNASQVDSSPTVGWDSRRVVWNSRGISWGVGTTTWDVWGDPEQLAVVSSRDLEGTYRMWDADPRTGTPHSIVVRAPGVCELYPSPKVDGVLEFSYIARGETPEDYLADGRDPLEWVPFNGDVALNQFAPVIAYKVAADLLLPRNTELAAYVKSLYDKGVREMRHTIRYDPAKDIHVAPRARDGRYAYAARRY